MRKMNLVINRKIGAVVFWIVLILFWQLAYFIGVDVLELWKKYSVPTPKGVLLSFLQLCENGVLFLAIEKSLLRGILGFLIAIILGVILGLVIIFSRYMNQNLKPFILGIQTLPSICWVPFSILWFGLSEQAILFVVVMGSVFSIAISVENAIRNVPPLYKKAALTMGASKFDLYVRVIFPASIPALIGGLKQGWSFAWRALMSGEVLSATTGLGQTLTIGRDMADINQVMLVMIIIIIVCIIIDKYIFSMIENHTLRKRGL